MSQISNSLYSIGTLPYAQGTITATTGAYTPMAKSNFEIAFKIAQLLVDRPALDPSDLKGFLQLVKDIEAALGD